MPTIGAPTVTIERGYFDTLIRRANFNAEDLIISKTQYDGLKKIAAQYASLRQNLLRGGVNEQTIDLLSQDDATIEQNQAKAAPSTIEMSENGGVPLEPPVRPRDSPHQASRGDTNGNGYGTYGSYPKAMGHGHAHAQADWAEADPIHEDESASIDGPIDGYNGPVHNEQAPVRPHYERQCTRSIILTNLAENVTHGDITAAVRGGVLLDIFLRPHDRVATVSFLQAADARGFFDHVRKHDLYIKNKRVEVRWNDRQFILPGHVASKIGIGATRNLVIRRCDPRLTEEVLRDDLEHIHNLVVIKVEFIGGSAYIRTNSVHNAMFARTCMMSRAKYKGSKIDWDVDECAQPFERVPMPQPQKDNVARKKNGQSMANRFHLLKLDEEEDDEDLSSPLRSKGAVGIAA